MGAYYIITRVTCQIHHFTIFYETIGSIDVCLHEQRLQQHFNMWICGTLTDFDFFLRKFRAFPCCEKPKLKKQTDENRWELATDMFSK